MRASTPAPAAVAAVSARERKLALSVAAAAQRTFLGALPASSRGRVLHAASLTTAAAKAVLFLADQPLDQVSFLLEGNVALLPAGDAGREVALDVVCPVQLVLPWLPLKGSRPAVSARTIHSARLLNIPLDDFLAELRREPRLGELLAQAVSERAQALLRQIESLKLYSATQRLAHYLLSAAPASKGKFEVVLPYRKHVIASQLGMTPESLSRSFAVLRPLGVSMSGPRVRVGSAERLRLFCRRGGDDSLVTNTWP